MRYVRTCDHEGISNTITNIPTTKSTSPSVAAVAAGDTSSETRSGKHTIAMTHRNIRVFKDRFFELRLVAAHRTCPWGVIFPLLLYVSSSCQQGHESKVTLLLPQVFFGLYNFFNCFPLRHRMQQVNHPFMASIFRQLGGCLASVGRAVK